MNFIQKIFDRITSVFVLLFSLFVIIVFWYFIYKGDVYDNWYPLVGHFVAAHGAFIGIIFYEWLNYKERSAREQFNIWGSKIKKLLYKKNS